MVKKQESPTPPLGRGTSARPIISPLYHVKLTVLVSLLAWPITYIFNNVFETIDQTVRPFWMMASGFITLFVVVAAVAKYSYVNDWVYYECVLFAFTAVIDLIISLEFNGLIHNFMSQYLKFGEPYLFSPWGSAIVLFDGIGFYLMYLVLVHLISNGKNWRSVGIYYGAGLINSMIVLALGILVGKHSPTFCAFLNVPYAVFPMLTFIRALDVEQRPVWSTSKSGLPLKMLDYLLAVCLGGCMVITIGKGITALSPETKAIDYMQLLTHEPSFFINDPAPFAILQAIVFLFYIVPIQLMSIFCLLSNKVPSYLWEVSLIHAGIMIQAQFSVIGLALDPQTPTTQKSAWLDGYFWFYNLFILIVPHVLLMRLKLQHGTKGGSSNGSLRKKVK